MTAFGSNYTTPGWQRAQGRRGRGGYDDMGQPYGWSDAHEDTTGPEPVSGRGRPGKSSSAAWPKDRQGNAALGNSRRAPLTIEGELVAKSTGTVSSFAPGSRVFHQKFGYGEVTFVEGNKLTIQFDKAGEKRVVDSFVERA
jgi:DNA helicase-2/ATP-dependent DNA helicase PcrA